MSCITPVRVPSKAKDARQNEFMTVPCGKCIGCLVDRQQSWIYRLERELATCKHSLFITLTYDVDNLPIMRQAYDFDLDTAYRYKDYVKDDSKSSFVPTLFPKDLQNYFKRVRKRLCCTDLHYFACGEYGMSEGSTKRPHYHAAIFYNLGNPSCVEKALDDCWNMGFTQIEPLIPARVKYVTKYILKGDTEGKQFDCQISPFMRCSHELGVKGYFKDVNFYGDNINMLPLSNGAYVKRPRYFKKRFDAKTDFKTNSIQLSNYERTLKEQRSFKRFCQDYALTHGSFTLEEVSKAFDRANDPKEIRRVYELNQRRKKDF